MKNLYILLITLFAFTISHAQIVNIPDANFKNALLSYYPAIDTNSDGEIQVIEAEIITHLFIDDEEISSLEGIEFFTNLEGLDCRYNEISTLDLTNNTNLFWLSCDDNNLTSLDVSQNVNLRLLGCQRNQITSLDLTYNIELVDIFCNQNQLTSLIINENHNVVVLGCSFNQLMSLDLSQTTSLRRLGCYDNNLISLNIRNGYTDNLTVMAAYDNPNLFCIQVDDVNYANSQPLCPPINGWCKDQWTNYSEDCTLEVEDINHINFSIYPNPAQDVLYLESQLQIEFVKIYNLQGQIVNEVSSSSIDVSELTSGLYFVQVTLNGHTTTKKFIKE